MDKLTGKNVKGIFKRILDEIIENRESLIVLDSALGDGDLGITMVEGFSKIVESISEMNDDQPGEIVLYAGFTMAKAVPSTMGTLIGFSLVDAGKMIKDKSFLEPQDVSLAFRAAVESIMKRGKAKRGDKTILDSLIPAADAIEALSGQGKSFGEIFEKAYKEAKKGMDETRKMKSVHGRAAWYEEKSIGKQDPGATVGMLLVKAVRDYLVGIGK